MPHGSNLSVTHTLISNPFHCSSETGACVDTKYPVAVFTFLSSACVWPTVINGSVFSAGLAHMSETMDYKKLNSMSTVDLLSHVYKDYRIPKKRKSSKVYENEW